MAFDPVGALEIAERAGVQRDTVWKWRQRYPDFPQHVPLNMGPVWEWPEVAEWIERHRRPTPLYPDAPTADLPDRA